MRYTITIDTDNAAFEFKGQCGTEIARILQLLACHCQSSGEPAIGSLRDVNGNTVGSAIYGPIPSTDDPRF